MSLRPDATQGPPPSLAGAYVEGSEAARPLFASHFSDPSAYVQTGGRGRGFHPAAAEALREQNAEGPDTAARRSSFDALRDERAIAVVTGQQPGLLLGPLHSFLKAVTAVSLARRLEGELGAPAVPVYWIQAEDHDFREVAEHTCLTAAGELARVRLAGDEESRVSLAHRRLGADVDDCLQRLEQGLEGTEYAGEVMHTLRRHYQPGRGMADAFADAMRELFAEHGLLTLQPRTPPLAEVLAPLHAQCIEQRGAIEARLREQQARIERAGFKAQVPIRRGAALSFFHPDGPEGPRYRLVDGAQGLQLSGDGRPVSEQDVQHAARSEPLRFSASALLRPLAQDTLLPTVAQVCGPAELAYFAQVPAVYGHFAREVPVAVPRLQLRWMDSGSHALIGELPVDEESLADEGPLARHLAATATGLDLEGFEQRLEGALELELEGMRPALERLDPGLGKACDRAWGSAHGALHKLVRKATRTALGQAPAERARLQQLRDMLLPDGQAQERLLGWSSAAARLGPQGLLSQALALDPLVPGLRRLVY